MERSALGFWLADAGPPVPPPGPPLTGGGHRADVLVVGGGYLGMWTAWRLAERGADVLLVEAGLCGHGPSGRNGGFVNGFWDRGSELRELFGDDGARRVIDAAAGVIDDIDAWARAEGVDVHLRRIPMLAVAAAPGQLGSWDEEVAACRALGIEDEVEVLDGAAARALCAAPAFLAGALWRSSATVHPGHLALGLRRRLIERGVVRVHERTRVVALADGERDVRAVTDGGARIDAGCAVLAVNSAAAGIAPLRRALSVASSHVVATEPVPDLLERLGWTDCSIADERTLLHYLRTTRDGRVVFGWGGGRMGFGGRRRGALDVDRRVQDETVRHLRQLLPGFGDVAITHAWGGPIDVSPVHLPWFGTLRSTHYGVGFTGNGVGPTVLGGRILADLATGIASDLTRLPIVGGLPPRRFPPEPLRFAGGSAIRRALVAIDNADQEGRRAAWPMRAVGSLPRRLGLRLPR